MLKPQDVPVPFALLHSGVPLSNFQMKQAMLVPLALMIVPMLAMKTNTRLLRPCFEERGSSSPVGLTPYEAFLPS